MPTPTVSTAGPTVPVITCTSNLSAENVQHVEGNHNVANAASSAITPTVSPGQFSTISSLSGSALKAEANGKLNGTHSAADSPMESDIPTAIDSPTEAGEIPTPSDEREPCPEESSRTPADNAHTVGGNAGPNSHKYNRSQSTSNTNPAATNSDANAINSNAANIGPTKSNTANGDVNNEQDNYDNIEDTEEVLSDTEVLIASQPQVAARQDYLLWDEYFMFIALLSGARSKDPSTQVGACIVNNKNRIVGIGYNGFPRLRNGCCNDTDLPWTRSADNKANTKYPYVVHAEANAILNRTEDVSDGGARVYSSLYPCNECAKLLIQAGIKEVIFLSDKHHNTPSSQCSRRLFRLANVKCRQFIPRRNKSDPAPGSYCPPAVDNVDIKLGCQLSEFPIVDDLIKEMRARNFCAKNLSATQPTPQARKACAAKQGVPSRSAEPQAEDQPQQKPAEETRCPFALGGAAASSVTSVSPDGSNSISSKPLSMNPMNPFRLVMNEEICDMIDEIAESVGSIFCDLWERKTLLFLGAGAGWALSKLVRERSRRGE